MNVQLSTRMHQRRQFLSIADLSQKRWQRLSAVKPLSDLLQNLVSFKVLVDQKGTLSAQLVQLIPLLHADRMRCRLSLGKPGSKLIRLISGQRPIGWSARQVTNSRVQGRLLKQRLCVFGRVTDRMHCDGSLESTSMYGSVLGSHRAMAEPAKVSQPMFLAVDNKPRRRDYSVARGRVVLHHGVHPIWMQLIHKRFDDAKQGTNSPAIENESMPTPTDAFQQTDSKVTATCEKPTQAIDSGAAGPNRTGDLLITNQSTDCQKADSDQPLNPDSDVPASDESAQVEPKTYEDVTATPASVHPARTVRMTFRHETVGDDFFAPLTHAACSEFFASDPSGCLMRFDASNGVAIFVENMDDLPSQATELVDAYQEFVDKAWNGRRPDDGNQLRHLFIMSLGLGGESGEVQELLKKHVRDGVLDKQKLLLELGDVAYYLTRIASWFGMTLRQVLGANQAKLIERQARGKVGTGVSP